MKTYEISSEFAGGRGVPPGSGPSNRIISIEEIPQWVWENKATRYNEGKLQWSLVDFKALEPMVRVLEFGAQKYSADNWKKGLSNENILNSMMRHITAILNGEMNDSETGLPHMAHVMCNAMFFSHFNPPTANVENNIKS